jgi:hypothetical protein
MTDSDVVDRVLAAISEHALDGHNYADGVTVRFVPVQPILEALRGQQ